MFHGCPYSRDIPLSPSSLFCCTDPVDRNPFHGVQCCTADHPVQHRDSRIHRTKKTKIVHLAIGSPPTPSQSTWKSPWFKHSITSIHVQTWRRSTSLGDMPVNNASYFIRQPKEVCFLRVLYPLQDTYAVNPRIPSGCKGQTRVLERSYFLYCTEYTVRSRNWNAAVDLEECSQNPEFNGRFDPSRGNDRH